VSPPSLDELRALLRDPDFRIRMYRSGWEDTHSPVYAWEAVAVCTEHGMPFPDWVMGYLGGVARRMTADDARAAKDVRKALPGILGFPAKPGPGRPLDPGGNEPEDALLLAILFATEIERGLKPSVALRKAAAHADLPADVAGRDERTLWRWVVQAVGLEHRPRTSAEWKAALRIHFGYFAVFIERESREIEQQSRETHV
jgi:hypothetical protein